jgi:tetratricopeptide (TPR) repeat protein/tRNA A-37 threonylcarbamoyl transferase component Bud32
MNDSHSSWFETPHLVLDELQRGKLQFNHRIQIPGYADIAECGRGGQGVVYSAIQESTQQRVAIKVLFENPVDLAARRRRFEREIEMVSQLHHPAIVRVYDGGITPDDRLYCVMEFIEGTRLKACVWPSAVPDDDNSGPQAKINLPEQPSHPALDVRRTLQLFSSICDAIQHAHQCGVIHRDLKPGNIVVDASGQPHVLDFGVAKDMTRHGTTASGQFLGTMDYASPEQFTASSSQIDTRADVYSLGVVLFEMLAGQRPYDASEAVADTIHQVTSVPAPRVSLRSLRAEPVDTEVDAILAMALARDPQERYQTVAAFKDDVQRYLAGEPLEAKRQNRGYVLKKVLWQHRGIVGLAACGLALLTAFAVTTGVMLQRTEAERAKLATVKTFLEDTLFSVNRDSHLTVRDLLLESEPWINEVLSDQPAAEFEIRAIIGNSYRSLGALDDSERHADRALQVASEEFGDVALETARARSGLALLRQDQQRFDEAQRQFERALQIRRELLGPAHQEVATTVGNLALMHFDAGELDSAEAGLREQLGLRERIYGDVHPAVALVKFNLARVLAASGQPEEAAGVHRDALADRESILAADHPDIHASSVALAQVFITLKKLDEAVELLESSRAELTAHWGADHWRTRRCAVTLIEAWIAQGRREGVSELFTQTCEPTADIEDLILRATCERLRRALN